MTRWMLLVLFLGTLAIGPGCDGHKGGLSSDSGRMSKEEFDKMMREAANQSDELSSETNARPKE
ncbi:hypothetical protein [Rhodopirellula sp. SWK7]|uniref:hypothetical protein n=1 Tax=Rhodopirellula sp. SWK7 TaxID=595460 RepID=UPI0002BEAA5D|nr:hypothetical protein [Rhodopirellula sp. SWK7]EMI44421.1 hypothetical protein RRSWK_03222 [Rhodopirellula sp. SWK7]